MVAIADSFSTPQGTLFSGNVVDGSLSYGSTPDEDPSGGTITVDETPVVPPSNGVLNLNADGSFSYQPNPGFSGDDSFVYKITNLDGAVGTAIGR